ncbi:Hypothetical protein SRAE_X000201600 [Strongyloides ratti]|uniref:Uncharacterized protein n=1 Tax=Strongyloides ratti TaxID=34506 RepID=A0A090MQ55_STRRB|nr:Hypothetical protein SRAE_X000201600 [Strongyloides ratti]CEF60278.1 Hypothetical protein SRAE_X000201600 [Strongyloides ratti]
MKAFILLYFFAIIFLSSKLNCYVFDDNQGISTVLPKGPIISFNHSHSKFQKQCNAGTCTYILTVPGLSNKIYSYFKEKIDNDKIIEATDETIIQHENENIQSSLKNIQSDVEKIENELNNLTSIYNKLESIVETIEVNLEQSNESLISIKSYIDEMNKTSTNNALYQCYVKAYESCLEPSSTTAKITLSSSTISSIKSTSQSGSKLPTVSMPSTKIQSTPQLVSKQSTLPYTTSKILSTQSTNIVTTTANVGTSSKSLTTTSVVNTQTTTI